MNDLIIEKDGESYIRLSAFFEKEIKPAIMVPFFGVMVPVIVRRLTTTQIKACGNFSLIETVEDVINKKRKLSAREMINYGETQYALVKKALVSPTYEEIVSLCMTDILRDNDEKELKEIDDLIEQLPIGPKRSRLEKDRDNLKLQFQFILPHDFVGAIISYALKINETDIKEISEDMLFEAATLAKLGHDNPSDHLAGNFSKFNKEDINARAWPIYFQRIKKEKENGPRRR